MVKEVNPTEVLLKEYKDKELIHYVTQKLRSILVAPQKDDIAFEIMLAQKIEAIGDLVYPVLSAVDKRINKDDFEPKVVL